MSNVANRLSLITTLAAGCAVLASEAHGAAPAPCTELHRISTTNRKTLREENGGSWRTLKDSAAQMRKLKKLRAVLDANKWPFTPSRTDEGLFTFKPADFDGDGRGDALRSECGAPSWRRICFLLLDRGGKKPLELEDGWMYLNRIHGRFYVTMDWYGPEGGGSGFPEKDFSHYYRITQRDLLPFAAPARDGRPETLIGFKNRHQQRQRRRFCAPSDWRPWPSGPESATGGIRTNPDAPGGLWPDFVGLYADRPPQGGVH